MNAWTPLLLATLMACGCSRHEAGEPVRAPSPPVTITDAGQQIDALRRGIPIDKEASPLPMARVENFDQRRPVNYEMQPPTIPHAIDNYQLTVNTNRCMLCHTPTNAARFDAPPVSPAHFMTRDGKMLEQISTRRYFCVQCHVVQTDAAPLVDNKFRGLEPEAEDRPKSMP